MKNLLFSFVTLVVMIVAADVAFLHGLIGAILQALGM